LKLGESGVAHRPAFSISPSWRDDFDDSVGRHAGTPVAVVEHVVVDKQNRAPLLTVVGPPSPKGSGWWTAHQAGGLSQPFQQHPPSREVTIIGNASQPGRKLIKTSTGAVDRADQLADLCIGQGPRFERTGVVRQRRHLLDDHDPRSM